MQGRLHTTKIRTFSISFLNFSKGVFMSLILITQQLFVLIKLNLESFSECNDLALLSKSTKYYAHCIRHSKEQR